MALKVRQEKILSYLRNSKRLDKFTSTGYLHAQLKISTADLQYELDTLVLNRLIEVQKSPKGTIKRVRITQDGSDTYVQSVMRVTNKQEIYKELEDIRNAIVELQKIVDEIDSKPNSENKGLIERSNQLLDIITKGSQVAALFRHWL